MSTKRHSKEIAEKSEQISRRVVIDEKELFELARTDATVSEIAARFGCHHDTIYKSAQWFGILQKGREDGNCSLKRRMFEIAMSGNVTMLIWLSKQRLGYKESAGDVAQMLNFNVTVNEVPK